MSAQVTASTGTSTRPAPTAAVTDGSQPTAPASASEPPAAAPPGVREHRVPASRSNAVGRRLRALWDRANALPAWLVSTLALVIAFGVWWLVASLRIWDPVFVPSPGEVWDKAILASTTHDGTVGYAGVTLWEHFRITFQRILLASGLAVVIGVPIGFAIGLVPLLRNALGPFITFLRQLPPLAYFSLLVIWFGIDEAPKLILLVIAAMPPIIVSTAAGLEQVNRDYVHAAQTLGSSTLDVMRRVLLPAALPDVFTGIRLGVGVAFGSVVAAETVNGLPGLGGMIRDAQRYNQTATVILGIVLLGVAGLVLELVLKKTQDRVTPWRGKQ